MPMENADDFDALLGHSVERNIISDDDVSYPRRDVVSFHAQIGKVRQPQSLLVKSIDQTNRGCGIALRQIVADPFKIFFSAG